ncbi:MAG: Hercynine oxygenase [bacterium]|nr:Hercynine oxygenase [bacterium]
MRFRKKGLLIAFVSFSLFAACKDKPLQSNDETVGLEISAPARAIYSGASLQLTAMATLQNGTANDVTPNVTWSIQPGKVGRINSSGLFTANNNAVGIETARADYKGQSATFQIDVTKRATALVIWPVTSKVEAGGTLRFAAIAEYQDFSHEYVTDKVAWSLTPGAAATIDNAGILHANAGAAGTETVTGIFQSLTMKSQIEVQPQFVSSIELITIPAGTFTMGDNNGSNNEKPAHEVELAAFAIGKYEVTNEQYARYLTDAYAAGEILYESTLVSGRVGPFAARIYTRLRGSSEFPDNFINAVQTGNEVEFFAVPGFEKYPVVRLNWYGAAAFCAFYGYRLPTEAEWEKACRGGRQNAYGTADGTMTHDLANYQGIEGRDTFAGLAPAGSFPPNPYGLYDMSGNAAEFVFDAYDANFYASSPRQNPLGPGPALVLAPLPGGLAIWRGGAWIHSSNFCRAALRGVIDDQADHNLLGAAVVGFRVARSL